MGNFLNPHNVELSNKYIIETADERDPLKRKINDYRAYCLRYGYVSDGEPLSNTLKYNKAARDSYHPWSKQAVGETFGAREYSKLIPIADYINLPVDIADDLLEGIARGEESAAKARAAAIKAAEDKARSQLNQQGSEVDRLIKQQGKR